MTLAAFNFTSRWPRSKVPYYIRTAEPKSVWYEVILQRALFCDRQISMYVIEVHHAISTAPLYVLSSLPFRSANLAVVRHSAILH